MTIKRRLAEFERLTPAEEKLRAEIGEGEPVIIGDGERPAVDAGKERQVSAAFLRYLILGGCAALRSPVPETGVQLAGARITGVLDLEGCGIPRDIELVDCRIDAAPVLRSARIETLVLNRSVLPGLKANRLTARGSLVLRGTKSTGEVQLFDAKLGGNLDCGRARLMAADSGRALNADRSEIGGRVRFVGLRAKGEVRLVGATLGGNFTCRDARFKSKAGGRTLSADRLDVAGNLFLRRLIVWGEVWLAGAKVEGNLYCDRARIRRNRGHIALHMQTAKIDGRFILRSEARIDGLLDLKAAQFGTIVDEKSSWPAPGCLDLDRCRYGAFVGQSPVTADDRIAWLSLQDSPSLGGEFRPHAWEQCAGVLRRMGHNEDARDVLIEKEKRQRRARRARLGRVWRAAVGMGDFLLGVTTRYGRRPLVAFVWLGGLGVVGAVIFSFASASEAIKPNNSIVLRSPEWADCADGGSRRDGGYASQLACFESQPEAGGHPGFQPVVYSADTLLPFVDLEMQEFWVPDAGAASSWGWVARGYLWLHIVLGWALSLLAVAGFSGLIKTDSQ